MNEMNNNNDNSHEIARKLTRTIEEGHTQVPNEFSPLVCKPHRIESWRVFKIMSEFVEGFELIRRYGTAATFFGSARDTLDPDIYEQSTELAARLAKEKGYAVITGGSAGIMRSANKGAYEVGGSSIGLNVRLPHPQKSNEYLTDMFQFDHFFVRKVMLTFASEVYIFFPGGFGTLDEFFEIVTLIQTKKIRKAPIIMYHSAYWKPFKELIEKQLLDKFKTISAQDMDLLHIVDSVDEAFTFITENTSIDCKEDSNK